jgi:RNA polymerase sigma factor (sigma-70 family)
MSAQTCFRDFEHDALPHLNSAYNLARWLTGNDQDAEDIVQEAYLRALKYYRRFRGGDARPWLLKIVRNAYYTWCRQNPSGQFTDFDEDLAFSHPDLVNSNLSNPEEVLMRKSGDLLLRRAIQVLPYRSREILILRELEEMSYDEISTVVGVPLGTVMSTLSRARARLRQSVTDLTDGAVRPTAENAEALGASCSDTHCFASCSEYRSEPSNRRKDTQYAGKRGGKGYGQDARCLSDSDGLREELGD